MKFTFFVSGEIRPRGSIRCFLPSWLTVVEDNAEEAIKAYRHRFEIDLEYEIQKIYPPQLLGPAT